MIHFLTHITTSIVIICCTISILFSLSSSLSLATELPDVWSATLSSASAASFTTPYISPSNDFLVVGSKTANQLTALNTSDGSQLWSTSSAGRFSQSPSIFCTDNSSSETCVVLAPSNTLQGMYVLNGTTGTTIATKSTTKVLETTPGALPDRNSNNNLLTCTGDTDFYAAVDNLTLNGGSSGSLSSVWSKRLSQRVTPDCFPIPAGSTSDDNTDYFAVGSVIGDFYLFNAVTGAEIWKTSLLGSKVNTRPVLYNHPTRGKSIVVGTADGTVHAMTLSNGAKYISIRVSTASGGLQALAIHKNARVVVTGDTDGSIQAVSLETGQRIFNRKISSSEAINSLAPIHLTSAQSETTGQRLGGAAAASSSLALIAGAANRLFFTLQVTNSEVKVVFTHSTSTSSVTGGIATFSENSDCIFATQVGEVRCINQERVLAQVHPSNFNNAGDDSGGLPSWAQIVIIVVSVLIFAVIVAVVVIVFVLPHFRELTDEEAIERRRQERIAAELQAEEDRRFRRQQMEEARARQAQVQRQRNEYRNNNFNNFNGNAAIFETFPAENNTTATTTNHEEELTRIAANANQVAIIDHVNHQNDPDDDAAAALDNNNNNKEASSGSYVAAARLQLPIFTNRLEMLNCKSESTPAPVVDLGTLSYLTENFSLPLSTRHVVEIQNVIVPALNVDILDIFWGSFVFAGRHSELLICKTSNKSNHKKANPHHKKNANNNANDDDDEDDDDVRHHRKNNNNSTANHHEFRDLHIPPTLNCVVAYVPSVRDVGFIVVDTELLLMNSNNNNNSNPLNESASSASSSSAVGHHHQHTPKPLLTIFESMKEKNSNGLGKKIYTCSICYDTVEIHRSPQQTSLILGSVCSAYHATASSNHNSATNQKGIHFTCGTCLSGSVEQLLDKGDTSLQLLPCFHPSCVELRNKFDGNDYTPAQQQLLIDSDESGYFIFDDFSGVLKPATLRRWHKTSTEASRLLGQKEILKMKKSSSSSSNDRGETQLVRDHCARIRALLRPRCPHCGLEFMTFTGCISVTCGVRGRDGKTFVAGCGRNFCGACMTPFPCPGGHGHDFMNANQIQRSWTAWRNRKINSYLADNFSDWRNNEGTRNVLQRVLRTSINDLIEAGVWPLQPPWNGVIS